MKFHVIPKISISIILIIISSSFVFNQISTAKVNYISGRDGTITMRSIGIGSNAQAAIEDAEKNAISVLLFRGLPESEQKFALIGTNEEDEKNKHKNYFNMFFKGNRYKSFVMSSIPATELFKIKGGKKSIAVDIKINLLALRIDLEQNNIIRKFGL
mgnify:CR=1 FL=1